MECLLNGGFFSRTPEREWERERERKNEHKSPNNIIGRQTSAHTGMNYNRESKNDTGCLGGTCHWTCSNTGRMTILAAMI